MTPPAEQLKFHLDQRRRWFHNEWFFKWHHIGSADGVEIGTFDGRQARYSGIEYSGSAIQVFWDAITRGVRKEISEQFAWLDEQVRRYNAPTGQQAIDESAALLITFAQGIRRDAIEKDRVLRGRHGTPASTGADSGRWDGTTQHEIIARAVALKEALRPDPKPVSATDAGGLDHLERQILAALVIDHHRPADRLLSKEAFETEYFISASGQWVNAILDDLAERDWVLVHRDKDGSAAILKPSKLKAALEKVMMDLGAKAFEVDAQRERVLSDVSPYPGFPLPTGWMFLTFEGASHIPPAQRQDVTNSESWTGRPMPGAVLSEAQRMRLIQGLRDAERRLDELQLDNSQRAQVLAYINAAKELAEAPDPPAELIWEILNRANYLAGIGSFFLALLALFVAAG